MQLKMKELVGKLQLVTPALSTRALVPVMQRYWFTGTQLIACSDAITIATPFETEWQGSLPKHMLDLLSASKAERLEVTEKNGKLLFKWERTSFTLDLQPVDDFLPFLENETMPSLEIPEDLETMDPNQMESLVDAMDACMRSVTNDNNNHPECLGVTMIREGDTTRLYGTNTATISRAQLVTPHFLWNTEDQIILPELFCKQAVAMLRRAQQAAFSVSPDFALLQTNEVSLYCRVIESEHPLDFEQVLSRYLPKDDRMKEIPEGMDVLIKRALIITNGSAEDPITLVTIKDGVARLESTSEHGKVHDTIRIEGHQNIMTKANPKHLQNGLAGSDALLFGRDATVFANNQKDFIYVVAAAV